MSRLEELHHLGYNEHFENEYLLLQAPELVPARIVEEQRGQYRATGAMGDFAAELAGRLRHDAGDVKALPAVGDWAAVGSGGRIHALLPRRTALVRKRAGRTSGAQVVAANVDFVFVVTALDHDFNPRRLERAAALVWQSGATPVLLLNKADVCADPAQLRSEAEAAAPGIAAIVLSAERGDGLADLAAYVAPGRTVALVGSSGVGKSTIVNRLVGADLLATGPVREHDDRGRHTTTSRQLVVLASGGLLIDTPGMRELGLHESGDGLEAAFADLHELARGCRFRDCRHEREPGCAVRSALADGSFPRERYESYEKLARELAFLERKVDVAAASAEKRRWKAITVAARERGRRKQ